MLSLVVALRKESVDRNTPYMAAVGITLSLSARRAWIEMAGYRRLAKRVKVALRKESVDRNLTIRVRLGADQSVALRKESVDRN